jgi:hypothetical protein
MLLELCVTELEDVALNTYSIHLTPQPVVQESSHPYTDDATLSGHVKIPSKKISTAYCSVQSVLSPCHLYKNLKVAEK